MFFRQCANAVSCISAKSSSRSMIGKPENVMLSLSLNYDVFKRARHNFMSHLTIVNILTILRLPHAFSAAKDFVIFSWQCLARTKRRDEEKRKRNLFETSAIFDLHQKEDKSFPYYSMLANIAETPRVSDDYKERAFKNRKTDTRARGIHRDYVSCVYMCDFEF